MVTSFGDMHKPEKKQKVNPSGFGLSSHPESPKSHSGLSANRIGTLMQPNSTSTQMNTHMFLVGDGPQPEDVQPGMERNQNYRINFHMG